MMRVRLIHCLIVAASLLSVRLNPAQAQDSGAARAPDKAAVKQLIREVLDENPELLLDALGALQAKTEAGRAQGDGKLLKELRQELEHDPGTFIAGNPQGDITVVEFFDYRCGFCKRASPVVQQLLKDDGRIRLALKEFPILGPDSITASQAAIAAMAQGKYAPFHDALMAAQGALSEQRVLQIATENGIDADQLRKDMYGPAAEKVIARNHEIGKQLGLSGTPSFIIGDTLAPGYLDLKEMQQLVAAARNRCVTC